MAQKCDFMAQLHPHFRGRGRCNAYVTSGATGECADRGELDGRQIQGDYYNAATASSRVAWAAVPPAARVESDPQAHARRSARARSQPAR